MLIYVNKKKQFYNFNSYFCMIFIAIQLNIYQFNKRLSL